jgi:hypothetical protein
VQRDSFRQRCVTVFDQLLVRTLDRASEHTPTDAVTILARANRRREHERARCDWTALGLERRKLIAEHWQKVHVPHASVGLWSYALAAARLIASLVKSPQFAARTVRSRP